MNLEQADEVKTINLMVRGFKPLTIKYGLITISRATYLIWRVIGTSHIFKANLKIVTENHGGRYEEHFKTTLINFRKDLIDWYYDKTKDIDMSAYLEEFSPFITELT